MKTTIEIANNMIQVTLFRKNICSVTLWTTALLAYLLVTIQLNASSKDWETGWLLVRYVVCLFLLTLFFTRLRVRIEYLFPVVLSILLIAYPASLFITNYQMEQSKATGDQIANALSNYVHKNGAYPNQLTDLVPGYLYNLPKTAMGLTGTNYKFVHTMNRGYVLSFYYRDFLTVERQSNGQKWAMVYW